ncbi:MAG: PrgI family protein [Christensenellaceae bacterium]
MEVRINKEVRNYQEALFFGLSLRQLICSALAIIVAILLYFSLKDVAGTSEVGWMCILGATPFAACGFFTYNGMSAEKFLLAWLRSEFFYPRKLIFKAENIYAKALANSSTKEDLQHD